MLGIGFARVGCPSLRTSLLAVSRSKVQVGPHRPDWRLSRLLGRFARAPKPPRSRLPPLFNEPSRRCRYPKYGRGPHLLKWGWIPCLQGGLGDAALKKKAKFLSMWPE